MPAGKSREEVKATLKSERAKLPRRRLTSRRRTSRFLGVGSSNRKNQWQARILYHGRVTHLGYYRTEEEAARVYDKVSISLHGAAAQTNFPIEQVGRWRRADTAPAARGVLWWCSLPPAAVQAAPGVSSARALHSQLAAGRRMQAAPRPGSCMHAASFTCAPVQHLLLPLLPATCPCAPRPCCAPAASCRPRLQYKHEVGSLQAQLSGLTREELQRALGVKPMDKSSRYRGVSKKKGRWEAKVVLNRKWAYRCGAA